MFVNDETVLKEVAVGYFKLLSHHLFGRAEEILKYSS
jgi:hypothetical protein